MATDFDERAATWDEDPDKVRRAQVVADAIRAAVPLSPAHRLLEYGAGTGLVTQGLAAHVGAVTLADPSAGMRAVLAEKVAAGGLPGDARIWGLDLAKAPLPSERFDLITTVMALHHIPDVPPVLAAFAGLLDAGGWLCIADLEAEDGSFHGPDAHFEGHPGFERAALAGQLAAAGFSDVRFSDCHEVVRRGVAYPLFLAVCRRAPQGAAAPGGVSG